ncbi:hypothetical protein NE850_11580 [Paraburkholderia sp. USG1]|uniref:hypothetical protein n=1 Tax=Paraburkholderia sp. USG1 TaxID=2952268 RepID=UPI00285DEBA5|nr:hypothetical protein [Paraburkholderia sp. USG1]MDR8396980.1 hypothetical protein [Paraburkholderia sp. USG1]
MTNPVDTKEAVSLLSNAGGMFAYAGESFQQVGALFAALLKFLPEHGDARQLALLGEDLCDDRAQTFVDLNAEYNAHAERFVSGGDRG